MMTGGTPMTQETTIWYLNFSFCSGKFSPNLDAHVAAGETARVTTHQYQSGSPKISFLSRWLLFFLIWLTLWKFNALLLKIAHLPKNMVIFHSYVSLPESI